jgi:hypothetical protein
MQELSGNKFPFMRRPERYSRVASTGKDFPPSAP